MTTAPFDAVAATYDARFTETQLGRAVRDRVWHWLDRAFGPGERVLELGCGTGADAVHLADRGVWVVATDVSEAMLASTRRRIGEHGADDLVEVHRLDMEDVGRPGWRAALGTVGDHPFDGAFSDFGAIDCVPDRRRLARGLGELVQPGGRLIVVTMPPVCPWEIGWHVLHGDPRTARRRWRSGALADTGGSRPIRVWYPSVRTIVHELAPWFRVVRRAGVGTLLPPTELAPAMERHPRVLALLQKLDAWAAMIPASAWAADHAIVEAVRA